MEEVPLRRYFLEVVPLLFLWVIILAQLIIHRFKLGFQMPPLFLFLWWIMCILITIALPILSHVIGMLHQLVESPLQYLLHIFLPMILMASKLMPQQPNSMERLIK